MKSIKSLLAIPLALGSMALFALPSQSQAVHNTVKVGVPEKALKKLFKNQVGGCAGTRYGCERDGITPKKEPFIIKN